MNREYDCSECGLCCTQYGATLYFYEEDIRRWREESNTRLLNRLRIMDDTANGWYSPDDGREEKACPFLLTETGDRCSIYPTRPLVCRHFANGGSACRELRKKHGLPVDEEP